MIRVLDGLRLAGVIFVGIMIMVFGLIAYAVTETVGELKKIVTGGIWRN